MCHHFDKINMNISHRLEVVDRVSETQLQAGENSNNLALIGLALLARKALT